MKHSTLHNGQNPKVASFIIRLGLAIVFVYAGVSALLQPEAWVFFVPSFSNQFFDPKLALDLLSVFQLFLAAWLVSGRYVKYSAGIAISMLAGIMVFNPDTFLITFRDIGLVAAAAALYFLDD